MVSRDDFLERIVGQTQVSEHISTSRQKLVIVQFEKLAAEVQRTRKLALHTKQNQIKKKREKRKKKEDFFLKKTQKKKKKKKTKKHIKRKEERTFPSRACKSLLVSAVNTSPFLRLGSLPDDSMACFSSPGTSPFAIRSFFRAAADILILLFLCKGPLLQIPEISFFGNDIDSIELVFRALLVLDC